MSRSLLSRVIAVLLLAFPVALALHAHYLSQAALLVSQPNTYILKMTETYSYSLTTIFFVYAASGVILVLCIEAIAFLIKKGMDYLFKNTK